MKVKGFLKDVGGASRVTKLRRETIRNASGVPDPKDPVRALADALATLQDSQRKVFLLHTEGELAFAEIARREGCPLGTVLSRMHYAVTRLRSALAPFHPKGAGK